MGVPANDESTSLVALDEAIKTRPAPVAEEGQQNDGKSNNADNMTLDNVVEQDQDGCSTGNGHEARSSLSSYSDVPLEKMSIDASTSATTNAVLEEAISSPTAAAASNQQNDNDPIAMSTTKMNGVVTYQVDEGGALDGGQALTKWVTMDSPTFSGDLYGPGGDDGSNDGSAAAVAANDDDRDSNDSFWEEHQIDENEVDTDDASPNGTKEDGLELDTVSDGGVDNADYANECALENNMLGLNRIDDNEDDGYEPVVMQETHGNDENIINSSSPILTLPAPPPASPTPEVREGNMVSDGQIKRDETKRGRVGLGNLGNTCFMNSTLQCLAHIDVLRHYFLSNEYLRHLNKSNPLGTGGEMATEFANLLKQMWDDKTTLSSSSSSNNSYSSSSYRYSSSSYSNGAVYPRSFKFTLGRHADQFVGYDQHDSQELATYLLDALHEDTNLVTVKPYVEKPEQEEHESDLVAAKKAWDIHLQRESSFVSDTFVGQVKSKVTCPAEGCGRVSTTYDPFMYLSVPVRMLYMHLLLFNGPKNGFFSRLLFSP
jgi:hypothetical protein